MRRVLLGLLGMMAAGGTCAEEYGFSALIQDTYPDQTIIQCEHWAGAKTLHVA